MSTNPASLRKLFLSIIAPVSVFILFSSLYFLTTNQIFSFDAITNAIACESIETSRWFHPNHLFYPFLGVLYFKLERVLGYGGFAIYSLARFNSLLMAGGLTIFFVSIRRAASFSIASLSTLFLGFTYSVWHYAVDGRAIGASVIFSTIIIALLLRLWRQEEVKRRDLATLSVFSSLYVLVHGISIFHIPAVWYFLKKIESSKNKKMDAYFYLFSTLSLVFLPYLVVYPWFIKYGTYENFLNWAIGYAGYDGIQNVAESLYWASNIRQAAAGVWRGWTHAISKAGGLLPHLISITFLFLFIKFFLKPNSLNDKMRHLNKSLFLWGLLTTTFLMFWSPGQEGFRLIVMVPWVTLLAVASYPSKAVNWFFAVSSSFLLILNLTNSIYPSAFIQNNTGYQTLKEVQGKINTNDLFLSLNDGFAPGMEALMPYFFPTMRGGTIRGRLKILREKDLNPLLERLKVIQAEGHSIYMADNLFNREETMEFERTMNLKEGTFEKFKSQVKLRAHTTLQNGRHLYQVEVVE